MFVRAVCSVYQSQEDLMEELDALVDIRGQPACWLRSIHLPTVCRRT